jgi:hypothetical protein
MDYKELFNVSAPGSASDFSAKVTAKMDLAASKRPARTMYTLTATLVAFAIVAGGFGLWLNANYEANSGNAPVFSPTEPTDESQTGELTADFPTDYPTYVFAADVQPGMFREISDIAQSFEFRMGRLGMTGYILPMKDGVITEVSSQNGQVMWFTADDKNGWELKKGDKLMLSFTIELPDLFPEGQLSEIGYFNGRNFVELYAGRIADTFTVDFVAPRDGEYFFYHINSSSLPQNHRAIRIVPEPIPHYPTDYPTEWEAFLYRAPCAECELMRFTIPVGDDFVIGDNVLTLDRIVIFEWCEHSAWNNIQFHFLHKELRSLPQSFPDAFFGVEYDDMGILMKGPLLIGNLGYAGISSVVWCDDGNHHFDVTKLSGIFVGGRHYEVDLPEFIGRE